eukprot:CAMPEP_0180795810 /NCGR_PEP_ID=MMETSP1038_2-20121128/56421_1 /TAXON_ID=632150 /ORGANISM="Azadinium spinosum, Strain 3D9" /LENGTH=73 /DNA_ID=CAMNT_0022834801 /DNA_START=394 /DNA_END=615 /DNA_ORIENTATION=+
MSRLFWGLVLGFHSPGQPPSGMLGMSSALSMSCGVLSSSMSLSGGASATLGSGGASAILRFGHAGRCQSQQKA